MTFTEHPRLLARIAGALYLIITACALFAYLYVRDKVIVADDMRLADAVSFPVLQLHSDLNASTFRELRTRLSPRKIIGKVSVEGEAAVERAREIEQFVDAIVLDTRDRATDRVGGTGMVHDWSISARIASTSKAPIILAGGLTPENVVQAIRAVKQSQRAPSEVRQHPRADILVVSGQLDLRDAEVRIDHPVGMRDPHSRDRGTFRVGRLRHVCGR